MYAIYDIVSLKHAIMCMRKNIQLFHVAVLRKQRLMQIPINT